MSVTIPQSHAEWLESRRDGIGASDAAAVLGMSRWKTNLQLWQEKTGRRTPEDIGDKPQVHYGKEAEQYIRGLFALDHPEFRVTYDSPFKIIRSDELPFLFCTPDGELEEIQTGRRGGLEIKTTEIRNRTQWAEWNERIPDTYYCQVLHQMLSAGWEFVVLRAQIKWTTRDGEKRLDTRDYHIERKEVLGDIEALREAEITFWRAVEEETQPGLILPAI